MNRHSLRAIFALTAVPLLLLAGAPLARANCLGGGAAFQGFADGRFTGCGDTAYAFVWHHQRAVQRLVSGTITNGPAGVDCGALSTVADGVLVAGAVAGDYTFAYDWGFAGADGCTTLLLEPDTSCSTAINSLPVNNFVIAGRATADPTLALAGVVSVDGNELFAAWILDNAGAPSIDGDPCGADATSFKSPPEIACGAIPRPTYNSMNCTALGCTVELSVASSQVPILDDCEVAQSRAIDCTGPAGDRRNLFVGRQLFYKKASCAAPPADTRSYIMSPAPFPGSATANFTAYSVEDGNLNGILDTGEDGSNGGTVNGRLDPFILPGNAPETRTVSIPIGTVPEDCVYLAVGLALDGNPVAPAEPVVTPLLSLNPQAIPSSCTGTDADNDGFSDCQGDCDDAHATVYPGAPQICGDDLNNDCSDPAWPALPDGEHNNDGDAYRVCQGDCDDSKDSVYPGAPQICDGLNNNCSDPAWPALPAAEHNDDGDAYRVCQGDCDDSKASVYPGAPQLCDGMNNNCSDPAWPAVPAVEHNDDGDAFRICQGDCNDANPAVYPGAPEVCNAVDDDCDTKVDEDAAGEDSDGDLVHNLCDNCPLVYNPGQLDTDGDRLGNSCDNCITAPNPDQADRDADQRGDLCDNCPDDANTLQDDSDGDAVGNVCDNCIDDPNPHQADFDHDFEGDACDLDDGLILITVDDPSLVLWQPETGFGTFNQYRGDLAVLRQSGTYTQDPLTVPLAARSCDLSDPFAPDAAVLSPGQSLFFLVTGNAGGAESDLGLDGQGLPRPNANPCP